MLSHILNDLADGPSDRDEICPDPSLLEGAMQVIMRGEAKPEQIAALLMGLRCRGEKPEHLVSVVKVMLEHATSFPKDHGHTQIFDTCGPGGVGRSTINISTATALLAATGGIAVAKHGNRSVSSRSGSADVLEKLGIKIDCEPEVMSKVFKETNFCFLFAPKYHPSMRHAGPVRKEIKIRSIFNLAGPLSNPAMPTHQLVGVGKRELMEPYAETLKLLKRKRALVVHGRNGMDEISLAQVTEGLYVHEDGHIDDFVLDPSDFGVEMIELADLVINSAEESAEKIKNVLKGEDSSIANEINANVAAVFWLAGRATSIEQAFMQAREVQQSGKGIELLNQVIEGTNS